MTFHPRKWVSLLVLAIVAASGASGQVILNQPPPGPGHGVSGLQADSGCDPVTAGAAQFVGAVADNFVVAAPVTVTQVSFWGLYYQQPAAGPAPAPPPPTSVFTVAFHANTLSDLPGATVATAANLAAIRTVEFNNATFGDFYRFDLAPSPIALPPGTYWIEIFTDTTPTPSPGCFVWARGEPDPVASLPTYALDVGNIPGSNWSSATEPIGPRTELSVSLEGPLNGPEIPTLDQLALLTFAGLLATAGGLLTRRRSPPAAAPR